MPQDPILAKFGCTKCGAETYALMDNHRPGSRQAIACWQCNRTVGVTHCAKVWTASTPQDARRKRLQRLHRAAVARAEVEAG
jgi:hypothetical protein